MRATVIRLLALPPAERVFIRGERTDVHESDLLHARLSWITVRASSSS